MMEIHDPNEDWLCSEMMKDLEPEEAQAVGCLSAIGYVVAIIIGICVCVLFGSCRSQTNLIHEKEQKDNVRVEVVTNTIYVPDTVFVEIPAQTAERTTADSTSHLENDYATSDARINSDGTLFHSLATKPQEKPVEVEKKIEHRDSIVYVEKSITETGQQVIEVERQLSWWEKTRIYGCYVFGILLFAAYRKPLWKLVKRFVLRIRP